MATPLDLICRAYDEGYAALLLTGRSLYDLATDEGGQMRPLIELLRRQLRAKHGLHLVTYSLAGGMDWNDSRVEDARDRGTIERALRAHQLLDVPVDQNELVRVIRGISSLCRTRADGQNWITGEPLRFAFLLEFTEHLTPGHLENGTQTDAQLVASELAYLTAQSLALRTSGNFVLFQAREGLIDELVAGVLRPVRLVQPSGDEKAAFLAAARTLYVQAAFGAGLSDESVVHLTTGTPNRGLEHLLRASHRAQRAVTAEELVAQKSRDVESLSEQTLTILDTARVNGLELRGQTIAAARTILEKYADGLRRGDNKLPGSVLLAGAPGVGKTDLALLTAKAAGVAAFQMHSPKSGLVGETERRARLQQTVLREWLPNIAFVDEITEAFPLQRQEFDGDSGASRAVTAALLTALSDETRRGRSLLIGSTNCPWRMGSAMRSRFVVIPVLQPIRDDLEAIIVTTAARLDARAILDVADRRLAQAAGIFYDKGATPRDIRAALSHVTLLQPELDADAVLAAASDFSPSGDPESTIYADLWAVRACSSRSLLPWSGNLASFPFPDYLRPFVDHESGEVDIRGLDRRLEELRPHVNV